MGLDSFSHIFLLLLVVLIVFGAGKLPRVMGDLGRGVRNFKAGMNNESQPVEKTEDKTLPPPGA